MDDISFFMPVHVRDTEQKEMWKEALRCIRKFYKEQRIFIIIDNCDSSELGIYDNDYPDNNITFLKSEFNGAGELLPFYYYYKFKSSKKAIFIQDSMFIQKPFTDDEINDVTNVKFFWHFELYKHENYPLALNILSYLKHSEELINLYYNDNKWDGCFGFAVIITLEFLEHLQNKYEFLNLLPSCNNRPIRCCFERIIALMCFNELKWNVENKFKYSFYGNILHFPDYNHFSFDKYKNRLTNENNKELEKVSIIKCWCHR